MPRTRPPYPEQFRREAVELVRISGRPIPEIAKDLGVTDQSLRKWVRQYEVDVGQRPGIGSDEREELKRLRLENRVPKEEREILKNAAAFFAKESDQTR
jgi:transposase